MAGLVQKRWAQEASGYVVAAVILAVIVVFVTSAGDSSTTSVGDRVFLTSGGTVQISGHDSAKLGILKSQIPVEMSLPLTAAEAVAAGWNDPIFCSSGRGRYFQKGPVGEGEPFFLMYNGDDQLIGMYQFSKYEMPIPWKRLDELRGGGGFTLIPFEHWGLIVYYQDPTRACGKLEGQDTGKASGTRDRGRSG